MAPAPAGPIRFDCPSCRTSYTVNPASAGRSMDCRACGQQMVVPGNPTLTRPAPAPLPVARHVEEDYAPMPEDPRDATAPALPSYLTARPFSRAPNGPVNRIVASAGAGLVFIALFMPMVTGPFGFWLSFIDVPWKAATVGFAIVDEVRKEERRQPEPAPRRDRRADDRAESERRDGAAGLVLLVALGSILYPLVTLGAAGFAGYKVACGRTARGYFAVGLVIGAATIMYAIGLLLLNAVPEMRMALILVSPGFGWAVMLVGCLALLAAGAVWLEGRG